MDISKVDLNLLWYLDVLLREKNVTRAAEAVNITQPAMSNCLRRLRDLFDDPLLIRTSDGMEPSEKAQQLAPLIRSAIGEIEKVIEPEMSFDPSQSTRLFRIMASDYSEAVLLPELLSRCREMAPELRFDILTPSDVTSQDLEKGKVDMAINRFNYLPQSFHQVTLWRDNFRCLLSVDNPIAEQFTLNNYLEARHIWVSKTGLGAGVGMSPGQTMRMGWVDEALHDIGKQRNIQVYTRHYQVAGLLAAQPDLIATLPRQAALLHAGDEKLRMLTPPFSIVPIELKMVWSPLLHHNRAHIWLRNLIKQIVSETLRSY
ncbi:PCP degradation transcriptional activation protein [BD1-7 clade bacterium]|uniref:PCP degradation transcriptional activation protein n=1 Tax=BD1-7 clade bacterium TaxID=2029982 RepID=A0A5S9NNV3_9GAMM|nr:PCP degradation transcriptional activation protein [BD1-7 clade bacterium]